jgi:diphthine synthase
MLTFVGLGLYDERSVTVAGREAIADADRVYLETYTSRLAGASVADLEAAHDKTIEPVGRPDVEGQPEPILDAAETEQVAFLVGGDPMIATTHVDLRLRAADRGIETRIVHGTTAQAAASSLTGLQNYRFGKAATLPFPGSRGPEVPESVPRTIRENSDRGLHTLVFLDIEADDPDREPQFLDAATAANALAEPLDDALAVVVARAGSEEPLVEAERLSALAERDFGDPLHLLVVPGECHHMEREALERFANAPSSVFETGTGE